MQKLRKSKRMTTWAIAFMLVFIIGAVFAMASGVLAIAGTASLAAHEVEVHWVYAEGTWNSDGLSVNESDATYTTDTITWTIGFAEFDPVQTYATATLKAHAQNQTGQNSDIVRTDVRLEWNGADVLSDDSFGIELFVQDEFFVGPLLGDELAFLIVDLDWYGNTPGDFDPDVDELVLTIEFEYEPA